ncbi:P-loop NTPase fold protein [Lentzea sp. CC55]|uniref:KAP family P-loop NTPase fold protein n=1 Tax=Lentzea sp. CC55 TaxID=2884909 RepID=UPI001F2A6406|nr:P-loop NTPase fold protein [Lentzea sp. CC55]MCG8924165.1 KAP family NTPase [Lentzea sp. CC55]
MSGQNDQSELIVDREVNAADEDRLSHALIAAQLEQLTLTVPTPSNIALYGAWGSGKSGIANLLQTRLKGHKGVRFVRFDAYKYAENPLRRNFISVTASALGITKSDFHGDLYSGRTTTDYGLPKHGLLKLVGLFSCILAACAGLTLSVVAALSAFQPDPFWTAFASSAKTAATATLLPATILTAIIAFVGKTFVVEKKIEKADSDEQFERVFRKLIETAKVDRLIIFVDELDRCSPINIVSTLDAVRTFLDVEKCVFIVATDQQVLEQALTTSLKQATPADTVNPYYSTGTAYLDKVFQYQIPIPPLLPQSITRFAADLVRARPGLWREIDIDLIVSVLIPSHVRSPRRVKNLLNAFVLAYRLAEARQQGSLLSTDIKTRVDEIARLVCFRVEFPLFARDLLIDAKLPEYILYRIDDQSDDWERFPNVPPATRLLVDRYVAREQPVDLVLAKHESPSDVDDSSSSNAAGDRELVVQRQGQQLIDYLSRTRSVLGPRRDLIHVQSSGNVFDLDGATADSIDQFAQDGSIKRLRQIFEKLSSEERTSAVAFLIQQARSAIGVEADNIARSVLHVIALDQSVLGERADALVEALAPTLVGSSNVVDADTLAGAWRLSLASDRAGARSLRSKVLESSLLKSHYELFFYVVRDAKAALSVAENDFVQLVLMHLFSDIHESAANVLSSLRESDTTALVIALEEPLSDALSMAFKAAKELEGEQEEATATPSTQAKTKQPTPEMVLSSVLSWITALGRNDSRPAAEYLIRAVLQVNNQECRDGIENLLPDFGQVKDATTATALLVSSRRRILSLWVHWLQALDEVALADEHVVVSLRALINEFWNKAFSDKNPPSLNAIHNTASACARLIGRIPNDSVAETLKVPVDLGEVATDDATAAERERKLQVAEILMKEAIADIAPIFAAEADALAECLQADLSQQEEDSALVKYVFYSGPRTVTGWAPEFFDASEPVQLKVIQAVDSCEWLTPSTRIALQLKCRLSHKDFASSLASQLPTAADLTRIVASSDLDSAETFTNWITVAKPGPSEVAELLGFGTSVTSSSAVLNSIAERRRSMSPAEHQKLVSVLLSGADQPVHSDAVLKSIGLQEAPQQFLSELFIARYQQSTNNTQRRRVLELWKKSGLTSSSARRSLVEQVLIPLASLNSDGKNSSAADLVLEFLPDLASPIPNGTRRAISAAVIGAASDKKLKDRTVKVLERMGYPTKRGFFPWQREIDESRT